MKAQKPLRCVRAGRGTSPLPLAFVSLACAAASTVTLVLSPGIAHADEPVTAGEPRLLSETGEITSVVDAFDKDDPFDLHLSLGFSQQWKSSNIRRETSLNQPGLSTGNFVASTENVAKYSQSISTLNVGAQIGIYHDLALLLRLPLVLADSRQLQDLDGSTRNPQRLADPSGAQLFSIPFKSPTRSGVDYLAAGLDLAIFNQQRDPTKPTWVVGVEGRFGVGGALHACRDTAPAPSVAGGTAPAKCPDPATPTSGRDQGISRAVNAVYAHTAFSRRFGYVEPYTTMSFLAEFPQSRSDFGATGLDGPLLTRPPLVGTFQMGLEVIPWEQREAFQRFVVDFRVVGAYHSPGRDYSELFDALGTSNAASLRSANPGGYKGAAGTLNGTPTTVSVADTSLEKVFFTGITDQHAYGTMGGRAQLTWQAGEFVKFNLGMGLTFVQSHLITAADACNPDFKSDADRSGPCHAGTSTAPITGIPNPDHRAVIDLPGRRFSADDTTLVDLWLNGVVMF